MQIRLQKVGTLKNEAACWATCLFIFSLHLGTGERSLFELPKNFEVDAKCHGSAMTTNYSKIIVSTLCNTVPQNITGSSALVVFHANSGTTYIRSFTKRDRNLEGQALLDCDLKCGILMF